MHMTRYWMTGCMALILLVAGRWPQRDDLEDDHLRQRTRIALTSKYDVDETVRQIERSVRRNGLPVVLRTTVKPPHGTDGPQEEARVLVLGDEDGHTPVLQTQDQARPELPWTVLIRQRADGQAEVLLTDPGGLAPPEGVSEQTLQKVADLPDMLKAVLT